MSDYNTDNTEDSSGQDQTEGGGEAGGDENSEADMIFAPEASKPGRNAGMLMVAFVLIGVGVIYFMRSRGGPAKAIASAEVQKADTEINNFVRDRDQIRKMTEMIKNTEKVVEQFNNYPNTEQVSVESIKDKNPFKYVPQNEPAKGPSDDPNAGDKKRKIAQNIFVQDLGGLRLQYLMVSATARTAMINNKLVKEGQEVDSYLIEKITPTHVIVSRNVNGYDFKAEVKSAK